MAYCLEQLQELDFNILHHPGKEHTNVDALFRLHARWNPAHLPQYEVVYVYQVLDM